MKLLKEWLAAYIEIFKGASGPH